jgi:hypothetical protein
LIAINQDDLGIPVFRSTDLKCFNSSTSGNADPVDVLVYAGPLSNGDFVIMFANIQSENGCDHATISLAEAVTGMQGKLTGDAFTCKDLWTKKSCGTFKLSGGANITLPVDRHQALVMRFSAVGGVGGVVAERDEELMIAADDKSEARQLLEQRQDEDAYMATLRKEERQRSNMQATPSPTPPWPTRGGDASHSGRGLGALVGPSTCAKKWTFTPDSSTCDLFFTFEVMPVVTGSGLAIASSNCRAQTPGAPFKNRVDGGTVLYAIDVETGESKWNATLNGTTWGTPLLTTTSEVRMQHLERSI